MPISPAKVNLVLEAATALAALDKEDEDKKGVLENAVSDCLGDLLHKDASNLKGVSWIDRCVRVIAPEDREQIQHLIKELKALITEPDSENQQIVSEFIAILEHTLNNVAVKVNDAFPIDVDVSKVPYLEAAVNGRWKTSTFNPSDRSICIRTHKEKPAEKRGAEESPSFEEWPFDPDLVRFLLTHLDEKYCKDGDWMLLVDRTTFTKDLYTDEDFEARKRFRKIEVSLVQYPKYSDILEVGPELLQIAAAFGMNFDSTPFLKELISAVKGKFAFHLFRTDGPELQSWLDRILNMTEEYPIISRIEEIKTAVLWIIAYRIASLDLDLIPSHLEALQKLLELGADPSFELSTIAIRKVLQTLLPMEFYADPGFEFSAIALRTVLQTLLPKYEALFSSTDPELEKRLRKFWQFMLENCTDKVYERIGAQILSLPPQMALNIAAWSGQPTLLRVIIEEGKADINLKIGGSTPLMQAVLSNNPNAVKVLIEAGADLTAVDREGKTAFQIAKENGKAYYAEMIEKAMREQGLI